MNLIRCEFPSEALHTHVRVTVLLPKRRGEAPGAGDPYPVAYLLHGGMDSGESWLSHTELAELVDDRNIAVVLPNMGNSFCLDEPEGAGYFTFLTEELPGYLEEILPLSPKREETFLGGLSMGGYGSLYAALRKPEKYGRVFSLSGAVDIRKAAGFSRVLGVELPSPLRDRKGLPGGEYDLFSLLRQVEPGAMPPISLQWALLPAEAMSSPLWKMGMTIPTSDIWVPPPIKGSLMMYTSPGCRFSFPYLSTTALIMGEIMPMKPSMMELILAS